MGISLRSVLVSLAASGSAAALILACGSDDESKFKDGVDPIGDFTDGSFGDAAPPIVTDNEDPPPAWCGGDASSPPVTIEGTKECPSDKNLPGCACDSVGQTAACWTGYRKNRGLGACKDGVATCVAKTENTKVWGDCVGQVGPTGTSGFEGCSCFSEGEWKIANTSPCVAQNPGYYAYSAVFNSSGQSTNCGGNNPIPAQGTAPDGTWSTDTLKVDCAGTFKLCFKIRAGDYKNPSPNDCTVGETCVDVDYQTPGVETQLPDLPTWAGADSACAQKWEQTPENVSPGYGEMIVRGKTVQCENVDDGNGQDYVFHRVQYCPNSCRDSANANNAECVECQRASSGKFN